MRRRRFLAGLGGGCSLGGGWYVLRPPKRSLEIRFWASDRASRYDGLRERIPPYVRAALSPVFEEVSVSFGGVVPVRVEDGYRVMRTGEWPRLAAGEIVSRDEADAADVNLLVTDGEMHRAPTGAGVPHLASVGGAEHLARAAPRDTLDPVVPYATETRVVQVLLHEIGHALGLEHEHGSIRAVDGGIVASPMVSSYAWAGGASKTGSFDVERTACGDRYPTPDARDGERYLSLAFSSCARSELRTYRGGIGP